MISSFQAPPWLQAAKSEICRSTTWSGVQSRLIGEIRTLMGRNHIEYFSDLTHAEKLVIVAEAEQLLKSSNLYSVLEQEVGTTLDSTLIEEVHHRLSVAGTILSKTELIMQELAVGSKVLLSRWPEQKESLRCLVNQSLPAELRATCWPMYLTHPEAIKRYLDILQRRPLDVISTDDANITLKCQALLESSYPILFAQQPQILTAMKAIASYYHSTGASLQERHLFLCIPIVVGLSTLQTAKHIECFYAVVDARVVRCTNAAREAELEATLARLLTGWDPELLQVLQRCFATADDSVPSSPTTAQAANKVLNGLGSLLWKWPEQLFAGALPIDTVLYIWDQLLIAGFEIVDKFIVAVLISLRESLIVCETAAAVGRALRDQGRMLSSAALQTVTDRLFVSELRRDLHVQAAPEMQFTAHHAGSTSLPIGQPDHSMANQLRQRLIAESAVASGTTDGSVYSHLASVQPLAMPSQPAVSYLPQSMRSQLPSQLPTTHRGLPPTSARSKSSLVVAVESETGLKRQRLLSLMRRWRAFVHWRAYFRLHGYVPPPILTVHTKGGKKIRLQLPRIQQEDTLMDVYIGALYEPSNLRVVPPITANAVFPLNEFRAAVLDAIRSHHPQLQDDSRLCVIKLTASAMGAPLPRPVYILEPYHIAQMRRAFELARLPAPVAGDIEELQRVARSEHNLMGTSWDDALQRAGYFDPDSERSSNAQAAQLRVFNFDSAASMLVNAVHAAAVALSNVAWVDLDGDMDQLAHELAARYAEDVAVAQKALFERVFSPAEVENFRPDQRKAYEAKMQVKLVELQHAKPLSFSLSQPSSPERPSVTAPTASSAHNSRQPASPSMALRSPAVDAPALSPAVLTPFPSDPLQTDPLPMFTGNSGGGSAIVARAQQQATPPAADAPLQGGLAGFIRESTLSMMDAIIAYATFSPPEEGTAAEDLEQLRKRLGIPKTNSPDDVPPVRSLKPAPLRASVSNAPPSILISSGSSHSSMDDGIPVGRPVADPVPADPTTPPRQSSPPRAPVVAAVVAHNQMRRDSAAAIAARALSGPGATSTRARPTFDLDDGDSDNDTALPQLPMRADLQSDVLPVTVVDEDDDDGDFLDSLKARHSTGRAIQLGMTLETVGVLRAMGNSRPEDEADFLSLQRQVQEQLSAAQRELFQREFSPQYIEAMPPPQRRAYGSQLRTKLREVVKTKPFVIRSMQGRQQSQAEAFAGPQV
eukprot:TRINITY_DN4202_c0_g1_i2.p1 TRINITY_DN4202_c0_g1~~TRINITY_DN4202_c0_g1_i2.p1  ORF type:complete len:1220 (-),score=257.97 TRINITY_DN4202_c0_g1_i2:541-4200(-)